MLVDTSGVLAALDRDQRAHAGCAQALAEAEPPFLLSPFVLAELDYLLTKHVSHQASGALLTDVVERRYRLEPFDAVDIGACLLVSQRFDDLRIGLTDASLVVLADRHDCRDVLTLDRRHFDALRTSLGEPFMVKP